MFSNNRKTIGVFIEQVYAEFQQGVCKGISSRAKELNYNVAFFTNFGGYGQPSYDIGESNIAKLPNFEELDGIIITPDTLEVKGLNTYILEQIKKRSNCPVVSIRRKVEDCYNVLIDDYNVLEEIITHFIEFHGFTRINFLAGPKGFPDSDKRLESYKRILREHNIPVEDERIYYGDLWRNEGYKAVDTWLSGPLERPQAIICANDYMALTVCNALSKKGVSVPDDIAVSGCDDIEDTAEYSPSITTARMPVYEMGLEAIDKIFRIHTGKDEPKNSYLRTITILRESCGCKKNWYQESNERRMNHIAVREELKNSITSNAYMSSGLTGITKLEDFNADLRYYVYENAGFKNFFLCLRKNWDSYYEDDDKEILANDEEITMEIGIVDRVDYSRIRFYKKDLLPPEFTGEDESLIYFFAMLHHQEKCFGYTAISFENIQTYMITYQAWLINVGNTLENIRIHGELNRLVYKLEDMYIRDDMTGLYNRRGLENIGQKYLNQCKEEHLKLMVFTADMDKLKQINDGYGHAKGDVALKLIADALMQAADDDEICVRLGGDEFMALGIDYDEKKMNRFIHKFVDTLDQFNTEREEEFSVYVSYGWKLIVPEKNTTIEECLISADSKMYQQKYEKESMRLKANLVR